MDGDEIFTENNSKCDVRLSNVKNSGGSSNWSLTYAEDRGGNIDADPLFAASGSVADDQGTPDPTDDVWLEGDYHLLSEGGRWNTDRLLWVQDNQTSPCVANVNMGRYGATFEASKLYEGGDVCLQILDVDSNRDCIIDLLDFMNLASHWLEDHRRP